MLDLLKSYTMPKSTSGTVLMLSRLSVHSLRSFDWNLWVCCLTRSAGGSLHRSSSRAVATWAWSVRMLSMALQMVGCACPTSFSMALFHPSHMLLVLDPPSRVMELSSVWVVGTGYGNNGTGNKWHLEEMAPCKFGKNGTWIIFFCLLTFSYW